MPGGIPMQPAPSKPPRVYAVTEEGEFFSCDIGTPSTSNDTHPRGVRMDSILPAHYLSLIHI